MYKLYNLNTFFMILLVHLLFGAAIGSAVKNIPLAIVLAFLGHYLLDFIPHIDYPLKNIEKKQWSKTAPDFLKIALDLCLGGVLVLVFSRNQPVIYIGAFFGLLPDGITLINLLFPNKILEPLQKFHIEKAHFFRNKKISNFWRLSTQIIAIILSIIILYS